jgi:hypothetical protein
MSNMVKEMEKCLFCVVCIVLLCSSCQGTDAVYTVSPSPQASLEPIFTVTETESVITPLVIEIEPSATTTQLIKPSSTVEPTSNLTFTQTAVAPPGGFPIVNEQPGDLYTTVFSIPVGGDSVIQYRGVDNPDMENTGPNAIAVLPDDTFVIGDLIGNRLLYYSRDGDLLNTIELLDLGIVNVTDLRFRDNKLFLLEISLHFSPPRYRVNQLSLAGELIASDDIPSGFYIENGLTGIAIDCENSVMLEIASGSDLYHLQDIQRSSGEVEKSGYRCNGKLYYVINSFMEIPKIVAGDAVFETQLTTGLGGFSLIAVFDDGGFYVSRDDVIEGSPVAVDQTVHYVSADMVSRGMARVPLSEGYYYIMRDIAVNSKGEVFLLLPRSDSLDVVQLNFYESLEPLPPSIIEPRIAISTNQP